jgi:hypothetical protein
VFDFGWVIPDVRKFPDDPLEVLPPEIAGSWHQVLDQRKSTVRITYSGRAIKNGPRRDLSGFGAE